MLKKESKERLVQIKLTDKEKKILQQKAIENGMSMTQYIRTKCIYN